MTIEVGDILQIQPFWYFGEIFNLASNSFWYRVELEPDAGYDANTVYENWLEQFRQTVLLEVCDSIVDDWSLSSIRLDNRTNNLDFYPYTTFPATAGIFTGDPLPSFVCWSYRLNRGNKTTRNGYKRFGGVAETSVSGNTNNLPSATYEQIETALASAISGEVIDPTFYMNCVPIIVRRNTLGVVTAFQDVVSAEFLGVSTQDTRKP